MILTEDILPGQIYFKKLVRQAFANNRFPQSLILTGKDMVSLQVYAQWLGQMILCESETEKSCGVCSHCLKFNALTHPDLHLIFPATASSGTDELKTTVKQLSEQPFSELEIPETADILINSVREMTKLLSRSPFEGDKRVIIFFHADRLRKEAANAFLKTLEEPPVGTYFILVSTDPSLMLSTILSRCQQLKLEPFHPDELRNFLSGRGVESNKIELILNQANGDLSKCLQMSQTDTNDTATEVMQLLIPLLKGELPRMLEIIGQWEKQGRDGVLAILQTFTVILRQAYLIKENANPPSSKHTEILKEYSRLDIQACLTFTDDAIVKLYRNVNTSLVLLNLCIQMRRLIRSR